MTSQLWLVADAHAMVSNAVSASLPTALLHVLEKARQGDLGKCQQPRAAGPSDQGRRAQALPVPTALERVTGNGRGRKHGKGVFSGRPETWERSGPT
jgi:hypothetical protein